MKMKIPFILSLLLAGVMAHADAPTPITVAVFGFTSNAGVILPKDITALVTADLSAETNLVMVERAELDKALSEQAFGLSGEINSDAAAKVGQLTGAKVLVAGRAIKAGDQLVIIANIVGTETSRLYAAKVQGSAADLPALTDKLSDKIAQTISDQYTNLVMAAKESSEERLEQIIKSISGTNRPSVSVSINWPSGKSRPTIPADTEFGRILLKAGFTVVDVRSDTKPDIEITGLNDGGSGPRQGQMFTFQTVIELKVQDRRTGKIITLEHQASSATDAAQEAANRAAIVNAVDALAERVLPLLAK